MIFPLGSLKIVKSEMALKDTDVRLFPSSRHRSRRILKKLVKRFGGEFRKEPCIYQMGDTIVAHPVMYAKLVAQTAAFPPRRADANRLLRNNLF